MKKHATGFFINNAPLNIKGFTLIEVMITVAIIGILAAITYPSYNEYIWRSNRTEAQQELIRLANLQEQLFVDQRTYTANMSDLGVPVTDGGYQVPKNRAKKLYTITGTKDGRTFILLATAQGVQVNDTGCTTLTINESGLKTPTTGCWE
jgi:type IV pilus assembly protein PilE